MSDWRCVGRVMCREEGVNERVIEMEGTTNQPPPPLRTDQEPKTTQHPTHLDVPGVGGVGQLGELAHDGALLPRVDERRGPRALWGGLAEGAVPVFFWGELVGGWLVG